MKLLVIVSSHGAHLRVPQIYLPKHPCDNSITVHSHYAAQQQAVVVLDGTRDLHPEEITLSQSVTFGEMYRPFTRLLLDSNFVSITDMAGDLY